jgi:hypothetical protein
VAVPFEPFLACVVRLVCLAIVTWFLRGFLAQAGRALQMSEIQEEMV